MNASAVPVDFETYTPVADEGLRDNVRHALSLGLPELSHRPIITRGRMDILANGPSANSRNGGAQYAPTIAVNGALSILDEVPAFWAACDPQPLVADFLTPAACSDETVYLVASKCHPSVFARLANRNVLLWHVYEDATADLTAGRETIGPGVSITLCALELAARLGATDIHTFGWDGCFMKGASHAGLGATLSPTQEVEVGPGGPRFLTTHSWACELQDAHHRLLGFPFPITVHGGGLFGAGLTELLPNRIRLEA